MGERCGFVSHLGVVFLCFGCGFVGIRGVGVCVDVSGIFMWICGPVGLVDVEKCE